MFGSTSPIELGVASLLCAAVAVGCGGAPRTSHRSLVERADSAGVELVHNRASPEGDRRLAVAEVLRIGAVDGPDHLNFSKIADLVVGDDGVIYVANGATVTVRAFDGRGAFLTEFARGGEGPGEFAMVERLWIAADSIVVADWNAGGKVASFSKTGRVLGSRALRARGGPPLYPVAFTPQGWIARTDPKTDSLPNGELREYQPLYRLRRDGIPEGRPRFLPIPRIQYRNRSNGATEPPLFASRADIGFDAEGRFYQSHSLTYRVDLRAPDGSLLRVVTKDYSAVPVPPNAVDLVIRLIDRFLDSTTPRSPKSEREGLYQRIRTRGKFPKPPALPPTGSLLVSPTGEFWLNRIDLGNPELLELETLYVVGTAPAPRWDVFNADGTFAGFVELPRRFWPMNLEGNRVTGVWLDDQDVEYVVAFEVDRAGDR